MKKHKLIQIERAHGAQKSRYTCENCDATFAYYDQGNLKKTEEYVNKYYKEFDQK